jgi:hypothetical protein
MHRLVLLSVARSLIVQADAAFAIGSSLIAAESAVVPWD